jgi:hypothetical protein
MSQDDKKPDARQDARRQAQQKARPEYAASGSVMPPHLDEDMRRAAAEGASLVETIEVREYAGRFDGTLVADAGEATASGAVRIEVSSSCGPVRNATLMLSSPTRGGCHTATTDDRGMACLDNVAAGDDYTLALQAPGYTGAKRAWMKVNDREHAGETIPVSARSITRIAYTCEAKLAAVSGKVVLVHNRGRRDERQQPIAGVTITDSQGRSKVSDGDGEFQFTDLCPDRVWSFSAPATVKIGSRSLQLIDEGRQAVFADAGADTTCPILFRFGSKLGELRLAVRRAGKRECGEPPRAEHFIANAQFRIEREGSGDVIETQMLDASPAIVTGLRAGTYIVTARVADATLAPCGSATTRITLCDGQVFTYDEFLFERRPGLLVLGFQTEDGQPIPDETTVTLTSLLDGRKQSQETRRAIARFSVVPGEYSYEMTDVLQGGRRLTGAPSVLDVTGNQPIDERLITMTENTLGDNGIKITVYYPNGDPASDVAGVIVDDQGNVVGNVKTNQFGTAEYAVTRKGTYGVRFFANGQEAYTTAVVASWANVQAMFGAATPAGTSARMPAVAGGGGAIGAVAESIVDMSAYPVLTEEIGYPPSPLAPTSSTSTSGTSGFPSGAPIGAVALTAISSVLGWKPRVDDPKGFLGALTQSFALSETEGHVESKWTPRSYAVQTDLAGGITGAQASVYARAQAAVDAANPLVDGLYALRDDADPQDVDALKKVVRGQMGELVSELGIPGGPRIARVEQLFTLLLGNPETITDPDAVIGQVGTLRSELGLWSTAAAAQNGIVLVNTVEEEQNVTNYRILVDYLTSLRQSWMNNRQFFSRTTGTPFFGTQLVLLSRQLSVIAESVNEVRFALDSVFIGPAERQTVQLQFPASVNLPPNTQRVGAATNNVVNSKALLIEELLDWVEHFATSEGPRLIQDGGKYAVGNTVLPVAVQLRNLAFGAMQPQAAATLPRGYRTLRVQRALQELASQLDGLTVLAVPISHTIPSQT